MQYSERAQQAITVWMGLLWPWDLPFVPSALELGAYESCCDHIFGTYSALDSSCCPHPADSTAVQERGIALNPQYPILRKPGPGYPEVRPPDWPEYWLRAGPVQLVPLFATDPSS